MPPIKGISRTSLWSTWKLIRAELRHASVRDVIDYVDFDVDPNKWIDRLLQQIASGTYEPSNPFRFSLGKSNGFSRTMTQPAIPDLVLYRTIVDSIYRKALRREHKHVYFKRERLSHAQNAAQQHAAQQIGLTVQYKLNSQRSLYNWLRYSQYRKHLLLTSVHPYLVVTDVTNFFDSILHSHIQEALRGLTVVPRMIGLLFFLLERLSIRQDFASSHGISLPVDEFDCSRTLAHMTLFGHDDTMVQLVGEDNYVRWMDDQNLGVSSKAEGLLALSSVGRSLARLHLSANSKKSRILNLSEARRHFHLDLNDMLDTAEKSAKGPLTRKKRQQLSARLRRIWFRAQHHEDKGEFDKILKRIYRLAGVARLRFLRRRATRDILANPTLVERISDYVRCSGTALEYIRWAEALIDEDEQVYADVNLTLIEGMLRIEPDSYVAREIRRIATELLRRNSKKPGLLECRAIAPILLLRFGDRRSLPILRKCFENEKSDANLLRAAAIVYASFRTDEFSEVRKAASRLLRNHLADVVKLIERIRNYSDVPARYSARLRLPYDSVCGTKYVDMRSLLTVRLLGLSRRPRVTQWVAAWKAATLSESISGFDKQLVRRLL